MSFSRRDAGRIARETRLHEHEQTPLYRPRMRRPPPAVPSGPRGFYAEITGRFISTAGSGFMVYSYARLIPGERVPGQGIRMIKDPDAPPATFTGANMPEEVAYWREHGAMQLSGSPYVPIGTRVWMHPGGIDGRLMFDVFEAVFGITSASSPGPGFDEGDPWSQYLDSTLRSVAFHRIALPGSLGPGLPEEVIAVRTVPEGVGTVGRGVWSYGRVGFRAGSVFHATWHRDRYIITAVDPILPAQDVPVVDYE